MKNNTFLDKILKYNLHQNKNAEIDMFIFQNKESILEALNMKVPIKIIYNAIISETNIKVCYNTLLRKLNYLKKNNQNISINLGNTSADEKPHTISADVNSNSEHVAEEPKKMSRQERLLAMRNRPDEEKIIDIQKDQKKFVWKPSIKE